VQRGRISLRKNSAMPTYDLIVHGSVRCLPPKMAVHCFELPFCFLRGLEVFLRCCKRLVV